MRQVNTDIMKKLMDFTTQVKQSVISVLSLVLLLFLSLGVIAQSVDNTQSPSRANDASQYLQNIEKDPNGVPNNSDWYLQPWIWAIVASVLILIIGLVFKNYGKKDIESEHGL